MFYWINSIGSVRHTRCLYKPSQSWALHVLLEALKFLKSKLCGDSGLLEPKIGLAADEVSDTGLGLAFFFFPLSHTCDSVGYSVWIWKEKCLICTGDLSSPPRLRDRKAIRPWSFARFLLWIMDAKLLLLCSDMP